MPDLINMIRQEGSVEGPFGYNPGTLSEGISHWSRYSQLSEGDRTVVNQVRRGEKNQVLLCLKGEMLLFEHKAAGVALPEADNKKFGYQVCRYPLHKNSVLRANLCPEDEQPPGEPSGCKKKTGGKDRSDNDRFRVSTSIGFLMALIFVVGIFGGIAYMVDTKMNHVVSQVDNFGIQLDNEYIASSIAKQLQPLEITSHKIAEALVDKIPGLKDNNVLVEAVVKRLVGDNRIDTQKIETAVIENLTEDSFLKKFKIAIGLADKLQPDDNNTWWVETEIRFEQNCSYYDKGRKQRWYDCIQKNQAAKYGLKIQEGKIFAKLKFPNGE